MKVQLEHIRDQLQRSISVSGRETEDVSIVAVTKAFPVEVMNKAWESGLKILGESRVRETEIKLPEFKYRKESELHLIGHLQSNKAARAVAIYDIIQSVDSIRLAQKIDRSAATVQKVQKIFLQVNTGNDPAKFGFSNTDVLPAADEINRMDNTDLQGLMVIAPLNCSEKELRTVFSTARNFRDELLRSGCSSCRFLSMGMSSDYPVAVEEGATHIRIGSALFGERPKW